MENPESFYDAVLFQFFGTPVPVFDFNLISAGSVNQAVFLKTGKGEYLLKTNHRQNRNIFEKEAEGLDWLRRHTSLHVPETFVYGRIGDTNYLLMEWISSRSPLPDYWQKLGEGIAELHMVVGQKFGLDSDNYIAILPQINEQENTWENFFVNKRLEPMLQRAFYEGLIPKDFMKEFRRIYPLLKDFFPKEKPALLHGDLWSGNILIDDKGAPALIDPAVYFGHREVDLAFSRLFGGFDRKFYEAYQHHFPLEPGFEERIDVYNLYPLLVHLNLFGASYLPGIQKTLRALLSNR
jgi:fructosamine-3-kinase